jgi:hypothetical protein
MAKLGNEIQIKIGEDGLIVLRQPTNREWNAFEAERYQLRRNKIQDNASKARVALFDTLVVKIENVEDDQGPITLETKDRIPDRRKAEMIFKALEADDAVEVKN